MITKMKTIAATTALAAMMTLGAQAAQAATLGSCVVGTGESAIDVTNKVTPTSSCFSISGLSDGDDDKLSDLNGLLIDGTTGGWTSLGKFEALGTNSNFSVTGDNLQGGDWSLFNAAISAYGEFMMVFKGGQDDNTDPAAFVGYILAGTTGTWSSPFINENNTNEFKNLSNVELFARGEPSVVPLPAAGWLLLMGLGGLGVASRRRRKAQHS